MFSFSSRPAPGSAAEKEELGDKVKGWKAEIRREMHGLDRQVREVAREEEKLKRDIKAFAGKDEVVVRMLVKNVVRARARLARDR